MANEPTDEDRANAENIVCDFLVPGRVAGEAVKRIAAALAAERERTVKACEHVTVNFPLTPKFSKYDTRGSAFFLGAGAAITNFRAAIRALGRGK